MVDSPSSPTGLRCACARARAFLIYYLIIDLLPDRAREMIGDDPRRAGRREGGGWRVRDGRIRGSNNGGTRRDGPRAPICLTDKAAARV